VSSSKKQATKKAHLIKAKEAMKLTAAEIRSSMMRNLAALVGTMLLLGILLGYDIVRYVAGRGVDVLFDDTGLVEKDPEYERAEQLWAEGHAMEAIELMRVYLKKNPREQYVALRIAEIYEKDFKNYLAAALEYEEVLKKKLPSEKWGWTAIHLCNLYSKLGRQKEYEALLKRIVADYGQTSAARKARKHLGLPEDDGGASAAAGASAPTPMEDTEVADNEVATPAVPSNLPPGFRPKK
jgi:tetratricopeptide (TPR) repeat protein